MLPFVFVLLSGGFRFVLFSVVVLFAIICFRALLRWFASFVLGSRVTVVFVGVTCDEPSGNKQMAHSQIVFLISLSLNLDIDFAFVLDWFPLGYVGFHVHLLVSFRLIEIAFACFRFGLFS